jgi:hypothetical protein
MNNGRRPGIFIVLLFLSGLIPGCITIDEVDQPAVVQAGQTMTITLQIKIPQTQNNPGDRIYFGFLAPRDWNVGKNATVIYTSSRGNGKMSLVPPGVVAKGIDREWPDCLLSRFGLGADVVKDMEWVTFQTDAVYAVAKGGPVVKGTIKIVTKAGMENELVRLGYFVTPEDGMDPGNNPFYSKELRIEGGRGQLFDFLHPQAGTIVPVKSSDNDYLTMTFDGNARPTALTGAALVFLQANAYTTDREVISVTERNRETRLAPIGDNKWRIQIRPRSLFRLRDGQTISRIEYYYTDKAGHKAGYDQAGIPFRYEFWNNR